MGLLGLLAATGAGAALHAGAAAREVRLVVAFLVVLAAVKIAFVQFVIPARTAKRNPSRSRPSCEHTCPTGEPLYLFRLKDEGVMFYYCPPGRPAARPARAASGRVRRADSAGVGRSRFVRTPRVGTLDARSAGRSAHSRSRRRERHVRRPEADDRAADGLGPHRAAAGARSRGSSRRSGSPARSRTSPAPRPATGTSRSRTRGRRSRRPCFAASTCGSSSTQGRPGGIARGRVTVYEPRGEYATHRRGVAAEGDRRGRTRAAAVEGEAARAGATSTRSGSGRLPRFPRRVGLVASASGAAIRDMIELFAQRWPHGELVVRPSRVQGDRRGRGTRRGRAIAQPGPRMRRVAARRHRARPRRRQRRRPVGVQRRSASRDAIFESVVPVVSAVGHEIDVTIADLVADHRAETPSAAVMALTPHVRELMAGVLRLSRSTFRGRRTAGSNSLANVWISLRPGRHFAGRLQRIHDLEQRLDDTTERLNRATTQRTIQAGEKLASLAARLESLSPLNVLTRGYSLTHTEKGKLVRSAADVNTGDSLVTRVAAGEIISRVEMKRPAG